MEEPSEEVVKFMISRVQEFVRLVAKKKPGVKAPGKWNSKFEIKGYRLVAQVMQTTQLRAWEA